MTDGNVETERSGDLSPKLPEEDCGAIGTRHPRVKEILSGIILLAARDKDPIPLAKVHSIFQSMKSHEPVFAGLRFSLTGAVCYSRDVDQTIHHLADGGLLKIVGGSAFVGDNAHEYGKYLSGVLTNSQIHAVHSVSLRFHDLLRREAKDPHHRP